MATHQGPRKEKNGQVSEQAKACEATIIKKEEDNYATKEAEAALMGPQDQESSAQVRDAVPGRAGAGHVHLG